METTGHDAGVPSWVDLGTDLEKTVPFYSALFGWECPEGSAETFFYTNATLGGKKAAGLGGQQEGMPSVWTTYVATDSAEDIARKVTDAGGQVFLAPMDVMEFGRMAIFADPAGAAFGVWQAGTHKGVEVQHEPGSYSWSELVTTDTEGSKRFYNAVFGWGEETSPGPVPYTEFKHNGRSIAGMMQKPDTMPAGVPSHWSVYFAVADINASVAKVQELGGTVAFGPMTTPAGDFAAVMDPHGAPFNIIQLSDQSQG